MKLYSLLSNIILEEVRPNEIEDSIEKHKVARIYYEGDETEVRGWRWIEPYVYGESLANNPIIRVYQTQGVTDTEPEGWKTFRVDKISNWIKTGQTFYEPISDRKSGVPKYNPNGDRSMIKIYKQATFE
jgi:hypothetical protein